jgi:hypothetical protein
MNTSQKIKLVSNREERTHYKGKFKSLQAFGNFYKEGKPYTQYESDPFNSYQNFLYKRALYGLKMFEETEVKTMHWQKKKRIIKVNKRTQSIINIWKQEITNVYTSGFFEQIFPKSPITKGLTESNYTDPKFNCKLSFKDLGIKKEHVVKKLHKEGILPKNFYELTEK